jgi:hypothetical protein
MGEFEEFIGSLDADETSDAEKLLKFAKLGATGPDIFYALADYQPEIQDLINFIAKLAGSIECIIPILSKSDSLGIPKSAAK